MTDDRQTHDSSPRDHLGKRTCRCFDTGLDRPHTLSHFLAEHVRHADIGDEQVDLAWVTACDVEGFWAVRGGYQVVAVAGEDPLGYLAEVFSVLDDEDRLAFGSPLVGHEFRHRSGCLRGDRQHDAKGRACAGFGVDLDVSLTRSRTFLPGCAFDPPAMVSASTVMLQVSIVSV